MKTVFSNDMLAHVWAQRSQPYGKTSNGSFSFDAGTLYSYQAKIAHFVADRTGHTCAVLLADRTWSVTTSAHQSQARGAIRGRGLPSFEVPNVQPLTDRDHLDNHAAIIEHRDAAQSASDKSRKDDLKALRRRDAECLDASATAYAALFIKGDPTKLSAKLKRESAKAAKVRAKVEAENAKLLDEAKVRVAPLVETARAAWRAGADMFGLLGAEKDGLSNLECHAGNALFSEVTLLRVDGDEIETSRGARFPVAHAKLAFRVLASVVALGEAWEPQGHALRLGSFHVDRVEADGTIVAGCHRVAWSEVERCAKALDLVAVEA